MFRRLKGMVVGAGPKRLAGAAVTVLVLALAVWVLRRELSQIDVAAVRATIAATPWSRLFVAAGLAAVAYSMLTTYDALALRVLDRPVPLPRILGTAFTAFAFSNNLGFAVVTGGSIRYRGYRPCGLSAGDVALTTVYAHACFFIGAGVVLAAAALLDGRAFAYAIGAPVAVVGLMGIAAAVALAAYLALAAFVGRPVRIWRFGVPVPRLPIALGQVAASTVDVLATAGALYVLLPEPAPLDFLTFAAVTVAAIGAGAASHLPGGLGVVEAVLLFSVPAEAKAGLLGAILLFRVVYYLVPLALAAAVVAADVLTGGGLTRARARKADARR